MDERRRERVYAGRFALCYVCKLERARPALQRAISLRSLFSHTYIALVGHENCRLLAHSLFTVRSNAAAFLSYLYILA